MHFRIALFLISTMLVHAAPMASADAISDVNDCNAANNREDYDAAIASCSHALQSGGLSNGGMAIAFKDRGIAYGSKGDNDRAIQDYDQAIRLKPDYPDAYLGRGYAHLAQGECDVAIQDFDQAIRLKPDFADAYYNRGYAKLAKGAYEEAIRDYDQAIQLQSDDADSYAGRGYAQFYLGQVAEAAQSFADYMKIDPENAYVPLWRYLTERRAGGDGARELAVAEESLDLGQWPGPVLRFYSGTIPEPAVFQAAADPDPQTARQQDCEATFYVGEMDLVSGRRDQARPRFQHAFDICPKDYIEFWAAKAELGRM